MGADGVTAELVEKGIGAQQASELLATLDRMRDGEALERLAGGEGPGAKGAQELLEMFGAAASGPAAEHLVFDPTLARGLSYYTGPIFEVQVEGLAGSMGGGGRYDNLIGMFQKQAVPAVGFSLGLERVLLVMAEREMFPELGIGPQLLLCRMAEVSAAQAIAVATELRAAGLRVELFAEPLAMKKQLSYANSIGVGHVAILGPQEVADGTVSLKDLNTSAQERCPVADVAARLHH